MTSLDKTANTEIGEQLIQFGTLSVKRKPNKIELIDHAGDRIAVVQFSNYDYANDGALALERANSIAEACNAHAGLIEQLDRLVERVAAMQAVVNAASLWEAASTEEDEDSDEGYETAIALEDAVKAYRIVLASSGEHGK